MALNSYVTIKEYIQGVPGVALVCTLHDFRGKEIDRQIVPTEKIIYTDHGTVKIKYLVDEVLTSKMIPGTYKLYLYIAFPKTKTSGSSPLKEESYLAVTTDSFSGLDTSGNKLPAKAAVIAANKKGAVFVDLEGNRDDFLFNKTEEGTDDGSEPTIPVPPIVSPKDYILDKCLTLKGIELRVRGGLDAPTIGGANE